MRIAFFADAYHPRISGQVTSLDEFCKGLTERGHEVRIVCPEYPAERMEGHTDLFPTIRVPSGTAIVSKDDRLGQPWRGYYAMKALKAFNPQVVHIQTEFSIGAMGRRYARRHGFPILSTCHTHYEMYMKGYFPLLPEFISKSGARTWLRNIYAYDDVIIAPTQIIRDVMKSYGIDSHYEVIPTGVNEEVFQPRPAEAAAFRRSLAESEPGFDKGCLLVYIGRIGKEKNLDLLAKAMVRIVREAPDTCLLIVGDGPRKDELQATFQNLGLSGHVAWRGFM
ncbi:MAG: glycosyltransferase, partial [Rectinemataceae bacterium]|nr:glycosyltransferase [Rectinemataceae bacterium]